MNQPGKKELPAESRQVAAPEDFRLESYHYELPEENIAQEPADRRDASRLLVLDRDSGDMEFTQFSNLPGYLPEQALIVANNSRVLPARIFGSKKTGGRVEFLLLTPLPTMRPEAEGEGFCAEAEGLLRASKGPRVGEVITFDGGLSLQVLEKAEFGRSRVLLRWRGDLEQIFRSIGHMPLPPYIRRPDSEEDRERYQTIYSDHGKSGSVAAPTAGLHFTDDLRTQVRQGRDWTEVTLYVGYGTFSPVRCEDVREHAMHEEYIEVSASAAAKIAQAKALSHPVVAVGTTSARTLEGMVRESGGIGPYAGTTDIYIRPGYRFRVVDHLLTNFHLPGSSLLIMVSALVGRERTLRAYKEALARGFRFFSYGDAMLIL